MNNRQGETTYNKQGCLMEIIEYNNTDDITVMFQDEYKTKVHTSYRHFKEGNVKNPYYSSVLGVGVIGIKYLSSIKHKTIKEYTIWKAVLTRCFDDKYKNKKPTYKDVTCCEEWLLFENFYEWLHSQKNFNRWYNADGWALDKDILVKGNKVYSPETCCLVPQSVNALFLKRNLIKNNLPVGVSKKDKGYIAQCQNPFTNKNEYLGYRYTPEETFLLYKIYKEELIKQVAQIEYNNGNITKRCYEAMMNYEVEITD